MPISNERLAALAAWCDQRRAAVDAAFGGMPDGVLWDLLDDMARLHTANPHAVHECAWCGDNFVPDHHTAARYCSLACCGAATSARRRRPAA